MTKIMSLTDAQKARFPEFVNKWIDIGLSTEPANREKSEAAIAGLYRLAKLKEPRVIWLPCPISAALSAVVYGGITAHRRALQGETVKNSGSVRSAVYSAVYSAVRSAARSAGNAFFGGSIWNAGYSAWADYFNEVIGISIDRNFLDITENCGFYWTLDDVCFASERPSYIRRDAEGRLHCENCGDSVVESGPCLVF